MIFSTEFSMVFLTVNYYKQIYRFNFGTVESTDWNFIPVCGGSTIFHMGETLSFPKQKKQKPQGKHLPT
jgi:hypothetical protein